MHNNIVKKEQQIWKPPRLEEDVELFLQIMSVKYNRSQESIFNSIKNMWMVDGVIK